jgi:DNA-binding HxlR family transcriptional regulator
MSAVRFAREDAGHPDRARRAGLDALQPAVDGADRQPRELHVRVPEERTALPAIDRALPVLSLFAKVVGRHWARYKIALLKDLQATGSGRWRIGEIKQAVYWLEPMSVTDLVAELRDSGVLLYEPVRGYYRLTAEARVVTSVLQALTIPEVEPRRMIKFIGAAINLALAGGAGGSAVVGGFASAVAVLREDLEGLRALADDGSYSALLEAADMVREHVDDMERLLEEHASFRTQHADDPDFMPVEHEALELIAHLGGRAAGVITMLTSKADELMRGGARIDRGDVRDFVAACDPQRLGEVVAGLAAPPPLVRWLPVSIAFEALLEKIDRESARAPKLPEPAALEPEPAPETVDPLAEMTERLQALDAQTSVADIVIDADWPASVTQHSTLMETLARRAAQLPTARLAPDVEEPNRGGVWRISRTTFDPREPGQ